MFWLRKHLILVTTPSWNRDLFHKDAIWKKKMRKKSSTVASFIWNLESRLSFFRTISKSIGIWSPWWWQLTSEYFDTWVWWYCNVFFLLIWKSCRVATMIVFYPFGIDNKCCRCLHKLNHLSMNGLLSTEEVLVQSMALGWWKRIKYITANPQKL